MELNFRQIHMDFHTSEHIAGIGSCFDPDEFADTLARAHVNSVTCFARCHHGYIYYDTKLNPERRHPHLSRNLLAEQIEACHKRGIRVPIYTTVQWDEFSANEHPEWLAIDAEGKVQGTPPYQAGFYRNLLVNSPYYEFLVEHIREICSMLPVDGFFLDIVQPLDDSSIWSLRGMQAKGIDPTIKSNRQAFYQDVIDDFKIKLTRFIKSQAKDATIFYNAGHISPIARAGFKAYTHLELESLPSGGGWGYMHYPLSVRYARTLGMETLGMTGKFHTEWGDFSSFKNSAALEFECFRMLALNSKCSIGDQLHPDGKICSTTYDLIQPVYASVEEKEPWCKGAKSIAEIGLFTTEEFSRERIPPDTAGAVQMLQEAGHQFDVLDTASNLKPYRVLILPDTMQVDAKLAKRLEKYVEDGGSLIASYRAAEGIQDLMGIQIKGDAPYSPDFILPSANKLGKNLPQTEHVMYLRGLEVEALKGTKTLAKTLIPYFNRDYRHFCSHRHTPSSHKAAYPAVTQLANQIYFMHPIFTQYRKNAPRWVKTLLLNALAMLLPDPLLRTSGPTTLLATLNEQPAKKRKVVHLLHYIPERRGTDFDIIEDVIPLYDISVSLKSESPVEQVSLVPQGEALPFSQKNGRIEFTVPAIIGHQMVEVA